MLNSLHNSLLPIVFSALILFCSSFAQEKNSNETDHKASNISLILKSGDLPGREDPFITREFNSVENQGIFRNGVSYGPYRKGQAPWGPGPSDEELLEDLKIIDNYWKLIRLYNSDDDTERIVRIIHENKFPIKVMLGIWLTKEEGTEAKNANIKNITRCIDITKKYPDVVKAVNVGNETQVFWSGHSMERGTLISYIRTVRSMVTVPVTTCDDHMFWMEPESTVVADEIDFIAYHAYPLWNGKNLEQSIPWMDDTLNKIKDMHPDKNIVLSETGWATNYNAEKKGEGQQGTLIKGEVGCEAQEKYLGRLDNWIQKNNMTVFLFEVFDEPWKGGGENSGPDEVEKHWGVFNKDRTPKRSFSNYLMNKD